MQDEEAGKSLLPISALAMVLSLLGGSFLMEVPFLSLRSPAAKSQLPPGDVLEDVDARLWQDPLAVASGRETGARGQGQLKQLAREVDRVLVEEQQRLMIVFVSVPGSPYAEDGEQRRRMRHALIAGLASEGYVPERPEHLGAFDFAFPEQWGRFDAPRAPTPFEWFLRDETGPASAGNSGDPAPKSSFTRFLGYGASSAPPDRVLVVWLNEAFYFKKSHYDFLLGSLLGFRFFKDRGLPPEQKPVTALLIGPYHSKTLKILTREEPSALPDEPADPSDQVSTAAAASGLANRLTGVLTEKDKGLLGAADKTAATAAFAGVIQGFLDSQDHASNKASLVAGLRAAAGGVGSPVGRRPELEAALGRWRRENDDVLGGQVSVPASGVPQIFLMPSYPTVPAKNLVSEDYSSIEELMADRGFLGYRSVNAGDDQLAKALVRELAYRQDPFASLKESLRSEVTMARDRFGDGSGGSGGSQASSNGLNGKMVLIGEADAYYARSLSQAVKDAAKKDLGLTDDDIIEIGYLRGLDGVIPGQTPVIPAGAVVLPAANTGDLAAQNPEELEQPVGKSQLDYVRRIALALDRADLRSSLKIRAIGVLGSDVYDKQLILQALRPRFPKAFFFTTDLDARLLQTSQYRWTRNLIIAAGHGLTLHKSLQGGAPPFRDSYQTATFMATRLALQNSPKGLKYRPYPIVFEVGRSGSHQLAAHHGSKPAVHPPKQAPTLTLLVSQKGFLFFPFAAILIWQAQGLLRKRLEQTGRSRKRSWRAWVDPWRGKGWRAFVSFWRSRLSVARQPREPVPAREKRRMSLRRRLAYRRLKIARSRFFRHWLIPGLMLLRIALWLFLWAVFGLLLFFLVEEGDSLSESLKSGLTVLGFLLPPAYLLKSVVTPIRKRARLIRLLGGCVMLAAAPFGFIWAVIQIEDWGEAWLVAMTLAAMALAFWLTPPLPALFRGTGRMIARLSLALAWFVPLFYSLFLAWGEDEPRLTAYAWAFALIGALYWVNRKPLWRRIGAAVHVVDFALPLTLFLIALAVDDHAYGEPFLWTEGVSVWPAVFFLWTALLLSGVFVGLGWLQIKRSNREIAERFFPGADASPEPVGGSPSARRIWMDYSRSMLIKPSLAWTAILWLGVLFSLIWVAHPKPGRGPVANAVEGVLFFGGGMLLVYLVMFAMEHTRACIRFIRALAFDSRVKWNQEARARARRELQFEEGVDIPGGLLDDYLDIELIVHRTRAISNIIVYPFFIIFLNLLAHSDYFDNWSRPFYVYLFFGFLAVYGLGCGFYLRRVAELARREAVEQTRGRHLAAQDREGHDQVAWVIEKIRGIADGALAPWGRHPILKAILWPLGGFSTLFLLEFLPRMMQ